MSFFKYLDPFYPYDLLVKFLGEKGIKSKTLFFIIFIIYALILAFIILKLLSLAMGVPEAMKIVVSGSMIPTLDIGDVVVLYSPEKISTTYADINENIAGKPISEYAKINYFADDFGIHTKSIEIAGKAYTFDKSGDVVVYYSPTQKKEIIHRAVLGINAKDGTFYLTKGDNEKTNFVIDADCNFKYGNLFVACLYPTALAKSDVLAKEIFWLPYLGYIKLLPMYLAGWHAE